MGGKEQTEIKEFEYIENMKKCQISCPLPELGLGESPG
jgi:hypothetical protein